VGYLKYIILSRFAPKKNCTLNYPLGNSVLGYWEGKRGPKKRLSLAEVMTLNILRFYLRVHDLKTFHRLLQNA
jgi:hypothetical protein